MVSLWDLLSLFVVAPAVVGGGLAALSIYHASRLRELGVLAVVVGIAVGAGLAVRAAGGKMAKRGRSPLSGPRVLVPYAIVLVATVGMPMVAFLVARLALVSP